MSAGKHLCCICHTFCKIQYHLKTQHPEFTPEKYYNTFLLKDGEGYCWNCWKPTVINWKNMEYNKYCSEECKWEVKGTESAERMKKRWDEDDEFRKRMKKSSSERIKKQWENPAFRERQSQLMKDRLKIWWENPQYKQKQSELMTERLVSIWENPHRRELQSKVSSETMKKTWENPKFQREASERTQRRLKDPSDPWGKTFIYPYKDGFLRSQLEIQFASFLDANNIKWQYEIPFSYIKQNGSPGTYLVDFYLPSFNVYIEIKGGYWGVKEEDYKIQCLRDKGLHVVKLVGNLQISEYCKTFITPSRKET